MTTPNEPTTSSSLAASASGAMFPVQTTWLTAQTPSQELLNTNIRDAVNFLTCPPRCQIGQTTGQQVTQQQVTALALDTKFYDNNSFWNSSSPSKIFFNMPGVYDLRAYLHWNFATGNQAFMIGMCLNSGGVFPGQSTPSVVSGTTAFVGSMKLFEDDRRGSNASGLGTSTWCGGTWTFKAGDYAEVFVYQLGGAFIGGTGAGPETTPGNQPGGPGGAFTCQVTARWIGQA